MKQLFLILLLFTSTCSLLGQAKIIDSKRLTIEKKIDGELKEGEWSDASIIEEFTELRPNLNEKEDKGRNITCYLTYNDEGVYFAGICRDTSKNNFSSELVGRDGFGNNDFVGIVFDTYKDNLNAFEYFITPLNEQMDAKVAPNDDDEEDFSWNSVWDSGTKKYDTHWTFEIFIPFAAIRFAKKDVQDWGVNVVRRIQKTGEQSFWSPINPNVNGFLTQEGYWKNLENIKPPIRLQLFPYLSYYLNHYPTNGGKDLSSQVNGGMDLKWGINQAFTLDATLIPDFGQVQSDNNILNLTPFEVRFNENRPFFTEGIELFNKGNFFYSRRIGGTPYNYYSVRNQLNSNEVLTNNPSESKLINASKISGRTQNGLGVAVLNAITQEEHATAKDMELGTERIIMTNPLTNYNVFVLDKTLKQNSSVSFVNTSVLRRGEAHDATVTSGLFNLNNKKNTWGVSGKVAASGIHNGKSEYGYSHSFAVGKTSGRINFRLWQDLTDTKFNSNDLGYFTNNNFIDHGVWVGTRFVKPTSIYSNMNLNLNVYKSSLYASIIDKGPQHQTSSIRLNMNGQLKNLWWAGIFTQYQGSTNDYYEPRIAGKYFVLPQSYLLGLWFESNNNKPYSLNFEYAVRDASQFYGRVIHDISLNHNCRFNQKFSFSLQNNLLYRINNVGFSFIEADNSIFARRQVNALVNTLSFKYNFTNRMGLTFRTRHYFSNVKNHEYFTLQNDGSLVSKSDVEASFRDNSINFFNVDMVYTWQIAQGSFVNVVWKNSIVQQSNDAATDYFENLRSTVNENQNNNLSVKIIYFLDYTTLRGKRA